MSSSNYSYYPMLRTAISKQAKNSFNRLSPYEARLLLIMFEILVNKYG